MEEISLSEIKPRSAVKINEYEGSDTGHWDSDLGSYQEHKFLPNLVFYRYVDANYMTVRIILRKFKAIKETPRGYWILEGSKKKFILKESRKRYCYPTKEEAWGNFVARKRKQLEILEHRVSTIKHVRRLIKEIDEKEGIYE